MIAVEINGLTKFYGKSMGVADLNFSIGEGEIYGFIGPNGAGKSTTIRLLLNLLFPTRGSGKIFGRDMVKDSPSIKKQIGFVPSEVHYYERMTVRELLQYSARFFGIDFDQRHQYLIDALDLDITRKIADLSMGNKKKVAVVQSLLHRPRLLILDEPTSGLDPLMQSRFFEILKKENMQGTTIFFSSHILAEVQKFCHRVAIIKDGRIVDEEDIISMKEKSLSRVTYYLREGTQSNFPVLPGIISAEKVEQGLTFLYKGDMSALLKELQVLPIDKLTITEPDLEEVFMHYYEDGSRKEEYQ
ncbi:MAG: ABC transporter ATP-binding protein [Bacteroidales bacterium]|nr:ABC transporter ATP-binding protein [Bacteroidales bacterium]